MIIVMFSSAAVALRLHDDYLLAAAPADSPVVFRLLMLHGGNAFSRFSRVRFLHPSLHRAILLTISELLIIPNADADPDLVHV